VRLGPARVKEILQAYTVPLCAYKKALNAFHLNLYAYKEE